MITRRWCLCEVALIRPRTTNLKMFDFLRRLFTKKPQTPSFREMWNEKAKEWDALAKEWEVAEERTVHLNVPFYPFLDGTDDELVNAVGTDDLGQPVLSFPLAETSGKIYYDFMGRDFHPQFTEAETSVKLMVEVCCGLLALRFFPRREEFSIPPELDFRKARLVRISWNASLHAWRPIFVFDVADAPEPNLEARAKLMAMLEARQASEPEMPPSPRPKIDPAAIQNGSAEDTAVAAWYAVLRTFGLFRHLHEAVRLLPRPWRAVYTTFWLKCEVDNGGHEQFFHNGRGELDAETQEDLAYIGAEVFLNYFTKARSFFDKDQEERDDRIAKLDDAFYQEPKNLEMILGEFIRAHPEDFTN